MTLILTQINKYGIVFASDSNVTGVGSQTREGEKIFEIPKLKSALCLAGTYSVGGTVMDEWMKNYIESDEGGSLREFTKKLCDTLDKEMSSKEKSGGCIIHIGGFVKDDGISHPEMWGVGNIDYISSDGEYVLKDKLEFREEFWNRDWKENNLKEKFKYPEGYGYQNYINGFTPGRVAFNLLGKYLINFLIQIWNQQEYKFRHPKSIGEYESLARFTMEFITVMFNLSDYYQKYIGGEIKTHAIEAPDARWFEN